MNNSPILYIARTVNELSEPYVMHLIIQEMTVTTNRQFSSKSYNTHFG